MAGNEISTKIKLDGEQKYNEQLRQITQMTKTFKAEQDALSATFNKSSTSIKKSKDDTQKLKDQLKLAEENVKKFSDAYGENDRKTLKWREAVAKLKKELASMPNALTITGKKFQEFGDKMQRAGKAMTSAGQTMTRTITAPLLAIGTLAIKTTAEFDASMSKVSAISGATGKEFDALRQKARDLGSTTKFSAAEASSAFEYMAMAGWKTEDMLKGVDGILNLAAASGTDLATTSDIVTDALTAFGASADDAGRLADIMAAASSNANTNVSMMGETFKYVAPVAGSLGMTMEDTALAIGLMANAGIKSSQAGTTLRTGLTNLVKPSKQAAEAMEKYGIEVVNADGSMKSMREIMMILRNNLGDLAEAEQASAAAAIFGNRAMSGWLAVINSSDDDFEKLANAIDNSSGTAKSMAEIMQDNLSGQLTILKSQLQELAISFGDIMVPEIRKAVSWLQKQVEAFGKLDTTTKKAIIKFALLAAAIGPVLTIGGKFVSGIGGIINSIGKLLVKLGAFTAGTQAAAGAQATLNSAIALTPLVAVGVAAAITGIVTAISLHAWKTHEARSETEEYNLQLRNLTTEAGNAASELSTASDSLGKTMDSAKKSSDDMQASAILARRYADELIELSEKSDRTTEEQLRMEAALSSLKSIYPSFNANIDEATGNLSISTEEINKNITALENQAKAMAYQEAYEEIIKGIVDAEKEQIQAEMKKKDLQDQLNSETNYAKQVTKALKDEYKRLIDSGLSEEQAMRKLKRSTFEVNGEMVTYQQAVEGAGNASGAAQMELSNLKKELEDSKAEISAATEEADRYKQAAKELGIEIPGVTDAMSDSGEAAEGAADSYGELADSSENAASVLTASADEIIEAYDKEYESALGSIKGQSGLFDELKEESTISIETIRANLEAHVKSLQDWNTNVQTLMSDARYGTDENYTAMVNYVVQAGQDMAPAAQSIVDAMAKGDEDVQAIIDGFGDLAELDPQLAEAYATAAVTAEYGADALTTEIDQGMKEAEDTIDSNAALMQRNIGTYGNQWSIASKSSGGRIPNGFKIGVDESTGLATGAVNALGGLVHGATTAAFSAAERASTEEGGKLSSGAAAGISEKAGQAVSAARSMANNAKSQFNGMQSAGNLTGVQLANGLISGIASKVSAVATQARLMSRAAINAANKEAGIESPSKVMAESGKNFVEGLVKGINKNKWVAEKSASEMAEIYLEQAEKKLKLYKATNDESLDYEVGYWKKVKDITKANSSANYTATMNYYNALKDLREQEIKNVEKLTETYIKQVSELNQSYADAVDKRKSSILASMDIWSEFKANAELDDPIQSLQDQVDAMKEYEKAIASLKKKLGGDSELFAELNSGDVKDVDRLKQIDSLSAAQLKAYKNLYNERSKLAEKQAVADNAQLKKETEAQIKQLTKDYKAAIKSEHDDLKKEGQLTGKAIVTGMKNGINSSMDSLTNSFVQSARKMVNAVKTELKIKSPSKVFADEVGAIIPAGIALGIEREMPNTVQTLRNEMGTLTVDPDTISGRSGLAATIQHSISGINADMIYDAIVAGMNGVKFAIDRREFTRILRDVGVATA